MAEKNLKVNQPVHVVYQAPNKETGATVVMEIYLPTGLKDGVNFPDVTLTELGASGVYVGSFTPDDVGEWTTPIHKQDGSGQVVKRWSVGSHNVQSVGDDINMVQGDVTVIDGKIDVLDAKVSSLSTPPMCS